MRKYDFRSDTVTKPTPAMRRAMFEAEVGDDVYGDDPTVNELQAYCAELFGKKAALFVASGTMGNQLAIMTHTKRGDQLITHETYHIVVHEVGALAVLSSVFPKTIKNDNTFLSSEEILANITSADIHEPPTTLLSLENATSRGTVWPLAKLKAAYDIAKAHSIKVHIDGARVFNAAVSGGHSVSDIAQYCDSMMFCLSKGLCAPVGSMLVGSTEFIERARKNRKILGGGMRQAGILAAAGLLAVKEMPEQLKIDHDNALYLADKLTSAFDLKIIEPLDINMVFFRFNDKDFDHDGFYKHLLKNDILINAETSEYRFVTNHDIDRDDIDHLIKVMTEFI